VKPVRYAYGVTSALLLGGAALSLATGYTAGAQVAQNDAQQMEGVTPRAGAPASFADLTQQLQPAVVNIATRQRIRVPLPERLLPICSAADRASKAMKTAVLPVTVAAMAAAAGKPARRNRWVQASSFQPMAMS